MSDNQSTRVVEKTIHELEEKSDSSLLEDNRQLWTFQRFKYEFFLCLSKIIDNNKSNSVSEHERLFLSDRKYYVQARNLIYWVPISRSSEQITFVTNFSDLSPRLQAEFREFCKYNGRREIGLFLKEIAARFFENIDYAYTHDSVLSHLKVVVEK